VNGEETPGRSRKFFGNTATNADSRRFAKAIVHDRALRKFETTKQLAELIERLAPRHGKKSASGDESFSGAAHRGERRDRFAETRLDGAGENFEAGRKVGGESRFIRWKTAW
jgi:hypothetical protein